MMDRKGLKRRARQVLKAHYGFLLVACLLSGLLATEFSDVFSYLSIRRTGQEQTVDTSLPSALNVSKVLQDIVEDNLAAGKKTAEALEKEEIKESTNPALGRTRGVLAGVINSVTSGSIFVSIAAAINSLVGSESVAVLLMILAGLLFLFAVWFYVKNTFGVVLRRIFLEARLYGRVPFERYMFLSRIRKWTKASFTCFLRFFYHALWSLTIVGYFIKRYAYFLVPYIVAENPDIRANQAITLSRQMMQGHKWECCKIELTFLGWYILSSLTFGLSGAFFSNPYMMGTFAEYYVRMREEAKTKGIPHAELLNDTYLFQKASGEALERAYPELQDAQVQEPRLPGFRGFLVRWFGVLLKEGKAEREYEAEMHRFHRFQAIREAVEGEQYPRRLYPIAEEKRSALVAGLDPQRAYTIWSIILMFFIFSCIGWLWEVSLHLISDGVFVNRGALHGPWLPIYGSGGILILVLLRKLRTRPLVHFLSILVVCGVLEYFTSYFMELSTGLKWWDYSGYFLNLNGRICAEGLLVFGIGGMAFAYILAPVFDNLIRRIKPVLTRIICVVLLLVFTADAVYSHFDPNTGKGITSYDR